MKIKMPPDGKCNIMSATILVQCGIVCKRNIRVGVQLLTRPLTSLYFWRLKGFYRLEVSILASLNTGCNWGVITLSVSASTMLKYHCPTVSTARCLVEPLHILKCRPNMS